MELEHPRTQRSDRTDYEQADFYLPAMPAEKLVTAVRRVLDALDR